MAFKYGERVQETSTSTGTGDLVLAGAPDATYQAFSAVFANGDTTDVAIFGAGGFESCRATYNSGANSITRGSIYASSNAGSAVNFGAGTKTIIVSAPGALVKKLVEGSLLFSEAQTLTAGQKAQAQANIGPTPEGPSGRLTLSSGTPVMASTVSGASTIYYTAVRGRRVPLYNGTTFTMVDTGGELSQALSDATKSPAAAIPWACYDYFLWDDSGTIRCTRGPPWVVAATITVTIATPAVVSWSSHGLYEGDPVVFTTNGALPTGITAGTVYFVGRSPAAGTFNLSTTIANAAAGTFIATSGTQSGAHTGTNRTRVRGNGAGTTELVALEFCTNAVSITNGPAAQRGTFVGTIMTNAAGTVDWMYGTLASGGSAAEFGVWNMYNRKLVESISSDNTDSWNYTTTTWRSANSSVNMRTYFVYGFVEDGSEGEYIITGNNTGGTISAGVGFNSTTTPTGIRGAGGGGATSCIVGLCSTPSFGRNFFQAMEWSQASGTGTWYGDAGGTGFQSGLVSRLMM